MFSSEYAGESSSRSLFFPGRDFLGLSSDSSSAPRVTLNVTPSGLRRVKEEAVLADTLVLKFVSATSSPVQVQNTDAALKLRRRGQGVSWVPDDVRHGGLEEVGQVMGQEGDHGRDPQQGLQ